MLIQHTNSRPIRSPPSFTTELRSKSEVDEALLFFKAQLAEERQNSMGFHDEPLPFWRTASNGDEDEGFNPFNLDTFNSHGESEMRTYGKPHTGAKKVEKDTRIDLAYQLIDEVVMGLNRANGHSVGMHARSTNRQTLHAKIDQFVKDGTYAPENYFQAAKDFLEQHYGYTILKSNECTIQWNADFIRTGGDVHMATLYELAEQTERLNKVPVTLLSEWRRLASDEMLTKDQVTDILIEAVSKLEKDDLVAVVTDAVQYVTQIQPTLNALKAQKQIRFWRGAFGQQYEMIPLLPVNDLKRKNSALKAQKQRDAVNIGLLNAHLQDVLNNSDEREQTLTTFAATAEFLHIRDEYESDKLAKSLADHRATFVNKRKVSYPRGAANQSTFTSYAVDKETGEVQSNQRIEAVSLRKLSRRERQQLDQMRRTDHKGMIALKEQPVYLPNGISAMLMYRNIATESTSAWAQYAERYGNASVVSEDWLSGQVWFQRFASKHSDQIRRHIAGNLRPQTWVYRQQQAIWETEKVMADITDEVKFIGAKISSLFGRGAAIVSRLFEPKVAVLEMSNQTVEPSVVSQEVPLVTELVSNLPERHLATLNALKAGAAVCVEDRFGLLDHVLDESSRASWGVFVLSNENIKRAQPFMPELLDEYLNHLGITDTIRYYQVLAGLAKQLSSGEFQMVSLFPNMDVSGETASSVWAALDFLGVQADTLRMPDKEVPVFSKVDYGIDGSPLHQMLTKAKEFFAETPPFAYDYLMLTGTTPVISRENKQVIASLGFTNMFYRYEHDIVSPEVVNAVKASGGIVIDGTAKFAALTQREKDLVEEPTAA